MIKITHQQLVESGARWLQKTIGARVVLSELRAATNSGEIPDIIGWKSGYSILVECKASRADFLADKKKVFRQHPWLGMGNYRLFLCPEGLIKPEELPESWGLIYLCGKKIKRIECFIGNIVMDEGNLELQEADKNNEIAMLVSHAARVA